MKFGDFRRNFGQRNMSRYAELMLASGRNYSIENHKKPEGHNCGDGNAIDGGEKTTSCPSVDFCPFNWSQPLLTLAAI